MIILDTSIISEFLRAAPSVQVEEWLAAQDSATIYLTVVSEAELRLGVAVLPEGRRRSQLAQAIEAMLDDDFRGRVLPFDRLAALHYAAIAAERRAAGRPIRQFDCQIAAIARVHHGMRATRNIADFEGCGIALINPWINPLNR